MLFISYLCVLPLPSFILSLLSLFSLQSLALSILPSSCCFLFPIPQGLKARNFIHSKIEENIKKKVQESDRGSSHRDALQQLIDSSRKNGEPLGMQVRRHDHCMRLNMLVISCWFT